MSSKALALVTGGAGFIGSHMVDLLLAEGYAVRVLDNMSGGHAKNLEQQRDNPALELVVADIRELAPDDAVFDNVGYIFHFAGIGDIIPSIERPINYMETNVSGTVRVLEGARRCGAKKFVYAASSSCYGLAETPTREDHPIQPQYPYALSKYMGEQSAFHWHQVYGLPVNAIRIFNAYGPRVRTTGAYGAVFGVFFRQKLAGAPFTVVGDGEQTRDFLYVTDVARAFLLAAETNKVGEIWNLGAGNPQSVNHLVDLIGGEKTFVPKRPGEPDCTFADISKISADIGWAPTVAFEEGVAMMMADIGAWENAPLWDPNSIAQATKTWFDFLGNDKKAS
ncbi:NAD-dependent epimerase/dehydratase family protein [Rhodospirillaceae bacterium KN72]|uniref:NAD-dependent epimerase/dehydratase family protein n=1 Tax=Pacificispira spongiicola TaxID=2729598 RepID=A0A7Y0E3S3_9PROT|nr:NAD-dependent epimerase/dehydratase family protein [Pacificispira spongiicola]NMM46710.1 NAD-dependent epimerase/dehydratase family protein [Pacificispira spongiicola]